MHSHILPGIDDGAPDIETSLLLVRGMKDMGITKATATPHIISDMYRNTPETIGDALAKLKAALAAEQIDFEVNAAAEYMLDSYFFEMLSAKKKMLTISDNILLTEFSYSSMPTNPEQMAFAIQTENYVPILAHPERYAYYHGNFKMYDHLSELGFLLQVNLLSLTGYYGKETAKAARYIIKNGLIRYAGTDMHHERHLAVLSDVRNKKIFAEAFEGVHLQNALL
jgi:protein-tyrosine phosphatase